MFYGVLCRPIRVEKSHFRLDGAIGHPYGTTFEVIKSKLVKVADEPDENVPDCGMELSNLVLLYALKYLSEIILTRELILNSLLQKLTPIEIIEI